MRATLGTRTQVPRGLVVLRLVAESTAPIAHIHQTCRLSSARHNSYQLAVPLSSTSGIHRPIIEQFPVESRAGTSRQCRVGRWSIVFVRLNGANFNKFGCDMIVATQNRFCVVRVMQVIFWSGSSSCAQHKWLLPPRYVFPPLQGPGLPKLLRTS